MRFEVREFPKHLDGTIEGYIDALNISRERSTGKLQTISSLKFKPMPYQIEVARRVLFEMDVRAILADEVGLGKTVEAGLIIREKYIRDELESALILTPASLTIQWKEEFEDKFGLKFTIARKSDDFIKNFVISSIHLAKREPYRSVLRERLWDMLVVDEAHHARNPGTQNYELVRSVNSKFVLFLTATPISNSLKEIYYLADVVRPGIFGTYREFEDKYFLDKRGLKVKNLENLEMRLEDIMIRNRRRDVFAGFTERIVKTYMAEMNSEEKELYDDILEFARISENKLRVIAYAKAATSSPKTVAKMAWKALENEKNLKIREVMLRMYRTGMDSQFSKISLLRRIAEQLDGGIIFTTYRETLNSIIGELYDAGFNVFEFHGGMSRNEKNIVLSKFREHGGFLVSTDSGGEGLNLQFTNTIINFDLPWNPMRVEQRIGRIHRIGQHRDVYIVNLAYRDTVEEHIIELLNKKIKLFRSVVGEVDAILGSFEHSFEAIIADILMRSSNKEDIKYKFTELGTTLENMRSVYEKVKRINNETFSKFTLGVIETA